MYYAFYYISLSASMLHAYAWGYKLILLKVCIQILKFLEQNGNYLKLQMCKLQFNL